MVLLVPALNAGWADPEGFFEKEKIERKEVAPGIVWIAANGERKGKPLRTHLLAIDLKKSGVTLQNLLGSRQFKADSRQRVPRSTVSQLAKESGALAAINTAFFDIKATQTPSGFLLHKEEVLREPQKGRPSLLVLRDGTLRICDVEWNAEIRPGDGESYPLATVNSPYFPTEKFALFRSPWQGVPEDAPDAEEQPVTRIVLEELKEFVAGDLSGAVKAVRRDATPLGEGESMLVFKGAVPFEAKVGGVVLITAGWQVKENSSSVASPPLKATEAFSGGPLLVQGGQSQEGKTKNWAIRHPRSAVGIDKTGERMLLVAVEGRSKESAGIGFDELADYFVHMECDAALNFDGGGSTTLGAVVDGEWRVLNTTSDGSERFVPVGLGVLPPRSDAGLAAGVDGN